MRRLKTVRDCERGATAAIVAILMVALLGFAALAVDVGLLYSEKAQLQSGADAGALGIAQSCAKGESGCSSPSSLAKGLVDANSLDGQSNVQSIDLDTINRKVTVTANPLEAGRSDNHVSLYFASVLGIPSSSVVAKSSATWGSPRKGPIVFPMTISVCQVKNLVDNPDIQLIRSHTANSKVANSPCPEGPAGKDAPGGFGWLQSPSGSCNLSVDLGAPQSGTDPTIDAKTGSEAPLVCKSVLDGWVADLQAGRDVVILLPVFNAVEGVGSHTKYTVISFAALSVRGWKFDGDGILPWTFRPNAAGATNPCEKDCRGIIGRFVKHVALSSSYEELGAVDPYGVTAVKLTN